MSGQCLKKLPINGFKWVKEEELSKFNEGGKIEYFFEVDICINQNK